MMGATLHNVLTLKSRLLVPHTRCNPAEVASVGGPHFWGTSTPTSWPRLRAAECPPAGRRVLRLGGSHLAADDEGLDVVPVVAVRRLGHALHELAQEVGDETGGAVLALQRKSAQ